MSRFMFREDLIDFQLGWGMRHKFVSKTKSRYMIILFNMLSVTCAVYFKWVYIPDHML